MYLLHVSGSLLYLIVPEYNIFLTAIHRSIFSTECGFRLPNFVLEKNIFALYKYSGGGMPIALVKISILEDHLFEQSFSSFCWPYLSRFFKFSNFDIN